MSDSVSRRDWLKVVGAAGAAGAMMPIDALATNATPAPLAVATKYAPGDIVELYSTSEVFIPPRGRSFMKFSFDFPEPSVAFGDLSLRLPRLHRREHVRADAAAHVARGNGDALELTCDEFAWAGGQEKAPGKLAARFRRDGTTIEWDAGVEMQQPIKTVTTVIRGRAARDGLARRRRSRPTRATTRCSRGYTFGAGDLHGLGGASMTTPVAMVQAGEQDRRYISSLDDRVRPKRFYFQPGERATGSRRSTSTTPGATTRGSRCRAGGLAARRRSRGRCSRTWQHVERAFHLGRGRRGADVPELAAPGRARHDAPRHALHRVHLQRLRGQLEILRWMATQIPADRVLVFLSAWDGRYYWDYPNYARAERMGGEAGFSS